MNFDKMSKDGLWFRFKELWELSCSGDWMTQAETDEYNSYLDEYLY